MTNILVPTDFRPSSLKHAENALKAKTSNRCNIVLFHAFEMPASSFDLLASNTKDPIFELMNEPFRQACKQLKDEYSSRIGKIIVRTMVGSTRALFRNFVEANDIDLIFCPDTYVYRQIHPRSVNPLYLFEKCGVPVIKHEVISGTVYANSVLSSIQLSTS